MHAVRSKEPDNTICPNSIAAVAEVLNKLRFKVGVVNEDKIVARALPLMKF